MQRPGVYFECLERFWRVVGTPCLIGIDRLIAGSLQHTSGNRHISVNCQLFIKISKKILDPMA